MEQRGKRDGVVHRVTVRKNALERGMEIAAQGLACHGHGGELITCGASAERNISRKARTICCSLSCFATSRRPETEGSIQFFEEKGSQAEKMNAT